MLSKTKKNRKRAHLKQYILRNGSISRADAVNEFNLDIRTATSYLEKLSKQGFCRKENSAPDGKGRPGIVYISNVENMMFAGIIIRQDTVIECVLTTLDGDILSRKTWKKNPATSKLTLFNSIADLVSDIAGSHPDRILGGIGVAVSRWLQPPLATYDLYDGLAKFLEKQLKVDVHRTLNINALAYDTADTSKQKDIIVLHAGSVIELGIIQNGRNIQNYREHENALAHLMVNKNGPRCYCGKKGCFENYMTKGALIEKIGAKAHDATADDIRKGIKKMVTFKNQLVDYIIQACLYLDQAYKPDQININIIPDIAEMVIKESKREELNCKIVFQNMQNSSVVRGAAVMAAFMVVKQYK